jgi:type III secretion protein L
MSGNIIKVRSNSSAPAISHIKKEAHEASLEAREILRRAKEEAFALVEQAQREKDAIFAENVERGYAAGLDKWNDALAEAWQQRAHYFSQNESELIKLSVAIAGKIVAQTIQADSSTVQRVIEEALKAVRSERRIMVQVNPSEESQARERAASLKLLRPEAGDIIIVGNPSVTPGGCIVESELGIVDAQIATQLASIEKALLRRFHGDSR